MSVQPPDQPVDPPATIGAYQATVRRLSHERDALARETERLRAALTTAEKRADEAYETGKLAGRSMAVGAAVRERDAAVSALRLARQNALKEAANEVHIEARWQTEQQMRGMFANGERSIDRLMMLERILLDQARAVGVADETPERGTSIQRRAAGDDQ